MILSPEGIVNELAAALPHLLAAGIGAYGAVRVALARLDQRLTDDERRLASIEKALGLTGDGASPMFMPSAETRVRFSQLADQVAELRAYVESRTSPAGHLT